MNATWWKGKWKGQAGRSRELEGIVFRENSGDGRGRRSWRL